VAAGNEIQLDRLARSFAAVGELIDAIQPDSWSAMGRPQAGLM
jgi:hypothetical protein